MDERNGERPQLDAGKLHALLDAVDRLTSSLSMDKVLGHILAIGQELTGSQAGSVILHDAKQNDLYFAAATGPTADTVKNIRVPVGKGKAGMTFSTGLSLIENDIKDHYKAVDEKTQFVTHSMVCVPLMFAGKCYGVLQLLNKEGAAGPLPYDGSDLELTQRLASQATIAIRNAVLFEKLLASSGLYANPEYRDDLVPFLTGESPAPLVETGTILFVDMRGFTRFCRTIGNDPMRIKNFLTEFFGVLADLVLSNGGIVNKFLGDGLLAVFRGTGAPTRAVRCAFAMHDGFGSLRVSWQDQMSEDIGFLGLGVGIATDQITIGAIGDDKVSDFTIIGGAVNLAAALERKTRDGKRILCDHNTFRAVKPMISEMGEQESIQLGPDSRFLVYDLRGLRESTKRGKIFLCHSHKDMERIKDVIIPRLDKHGYEFFLAETSIPGGERWDKAIGNAIRTSDYFVVVVSKNALESPPVSDELHFAFGLERTKSRTWIIPVLLEVGINPSDIHWQLPRLQYKDISSTDGLADFERMLAELGSPANGPHGAEASRA